MGNLHTSVNDFQGLLNLSERYLAAAQQHKNQSEEGTAYYFRGFAQLNLGRYRDAKVNLILALSLHEETQYPFISIVHLAFARLFIEEGNLNEALKHISKSIEADSKNNFLYNEGERVYLLSRIYQKQGNMELAVDELITGLNSDAVQTDFLQVLKLLERLIELAELNEDIAMQARYLKQYKEVYEQSFNEQQSRLLAINKVRQDVFQKEEDIKLLQKENELQAQRSLVQEQRNQYQLFFTIVILLSLAVVSVLLVRARKQQERLNVYSKELEKATKAKSDFLARMSHEIRTPINAISGLTKLMQRSTDKPEDVTNLQQIDDASHTLLGVINDILDFSKIEAGKLDIEVTNFQLDKLVSQSIRLQSLKAHEKQIELIQHIARDVPLHLRGDGLRIQQILVNLLSNAVKFTDDGLVSVTVKQQYSDTGVMLEFAVKDTGIGLSEDQADRLFQSFSQVDESISRKYGGTGLGLAICKQLCELMGGKIWVESKPNEGSTFHFTVLLEEDKSQEVVSPSKKLSSLRILVADDVSLSRQAIAEALLQANINADLADGGEQALSKMRLAATDGKPYDILILDWKMPDLDGMEVVAIINQQFLANKPKIIMLSAFDFSQMREQAQHLGIKFFIEKPFSASELINKLQELAFNIKVDTDISLPKAQNIPDLIGKRILLAEDNKLNQKVAKGFLKDTKAEIFLAENGLEVLEFLDVGLEFDCILMDVQMPELDGLAATYKIRKEYNIDTPIIAMTAHAMKQDLEKSAAAGMTAHVTKPIDPEYLYQVLSEVLLAEPKSKEKLVDSNGTLQAISSANQIEKLLLVDYQKARENLFMDEDCFQSMLVDFADMKPTIDSLESCIQEKDYQAIYKIAHDAVSTLTYIGAFELAKLAKSLEITLDRNEQDKTSGFKEQLTLFNEALVKLLDQVSSDLAKE